MIKNKNQSKNAIGFCEYKTSVDVKKQNLRRYYGKFNDK